MPMASLSLSWLWEEIYASHSFILNLRFSEILKLDPLIVVILMTEFIALGCWILSLLTKNYSQVDKIWSISPFWFLWTFALWSDFDHRCVLIACLGTLWGCRLTFNFARKGGYGSHGEDYRWAELRKIIGNKILFELFNVSFIAFYQNFLLMLIACPGYIAFQNRSVPLSLFDAILAVLFLLLLGAETLADQQQWNFQSKKYAAKAKGKNLDPNAYGQEFLTTGLFFYSRHPNFFCEICIWWTVYLFSFSAGGSLFNWTILGPILLTLLFQGSTKFTEKITSAKYPGYALYQATTSMLIPLPPSRQKQQ